MLTYLWLDYRNYHGFFDSSIKNYNQHLPTLRIILHPTKNVRYLRNNPQKNPTHKTKSNNLHLYPSC